MGNWWRNRGGAEYGGQGGKQPQLWVWPQVLVRVRWQGGVWWQVALHLLAEFPMTPPGVAAALFLALSMSVCAG